MDIHLELFCAINNSVPRRKHESAGWLGAPLPAAFENELQWVIDVLNGKGLFFKDFYPEDNEIHDRLLRETQPILQALVDGWLESGPNLEKFLRHDLALLAEIRRCWNDHPIRIFGTASGSAVLESALADRISGDPRAEAMRFFLLLVTNPDWEKLAGPCIGCGAYYIRRTAKNRAYCSRLCATRTTAIRSTQKRRKDEHAEKLRRAGLAAQQWPRVRTSLGWKQWVSEAEPDISVKFLTRAVNRGELKPPVRH